MSGNDGGLSWGRRVEPGADRWERLRGVAGGRVTPVRAAVVMLLVVGAMWILELADVALFQTLDSLAMEPRVPDSLPEVFTAPFAHFGLSHLSANTVPLLVLGFLVALRGIGRFVLVTLMIMAIGGVLTWLTELPGLVGGASGVVFGYFGFLVARGIFDRRLVDIAVAVAVVLVYGGMIWGVLPTQEFVSWKGHLFGLLAGVVTAWAMRRRAEPAGRRPALGSRAGKLR